MSGKKAVISGYAMGNFKAFSSQNLSSLFISFAWFDERNEQDWEKELIYKTKFPFRGLGHEETRLVYTEKDPRHFFLLHDTFYPDRGGSG